MPKLQEWLDETHEQGFELLRHFLSRFFDSDLISSPGQMTPALIGAFSVFLPWFPLIIGPLRGKYAYLSGLPSPQPYLAAVRADQLWLITLMMSGIGLLTAIKWQAVFPDLRDLGSLASLPIAPYKMFIAKLFALVMVATAVITTLNLFPAFLFPMVSGSHWALSGSLGRRIWALGIACVAGSYFTLFAMIAVQGLLLTLLRARLFNRISGYVQGLLVPGMLSLVVLSFSIQPRVLRTVLQPHLARLLPPVWFLGLCRKSLGDPDPAMTVLAHRAAMALFAAIVLTIASHVFSYHRYRTTLLAEVRPTRVRRLQFALLHFLFRKPRREAIVAFVVTTMAKSSQHRTILMAYVGGAVAILVSGVLGIHTVVMSAKSLAATFIYGHVVLTLFLLVGVRHLFSIPTELRANWIFQLTEREGRRQWLSAVDQLILCLGAAAVLLAPFPLEVALLGWLGVRETILLAALGWVCFEAMFYSWEKLPFTCSYLPGKVPMWIRALQLFAILGLLPAMNAVLLACLYHRMAFYFTLLLLLASARWMHLSRMAGRDDLQLKYDELPEPAVRSLHLLRG